jgi:hypothetical protein
VNTTQARNDILRVSVRVHGVDCGVVVFDEVGRMFSPSMRFKAPWSSYKDNARPNAVEWGSPRVAAFIRACHSEGEVSGYKLRESNIQDWLFRAMSGSGRDSSLEVGAIAAVRSPSWLKLT